jgi:CubicO group peptidase (beta-lactamase class C family)
MKRSLLILILLAGLLLPGCTPAGSTQDSGKALQSPVYPGTEWLQADSPESLGWSTAKLAQAQAYATHIGLAAVMVIDNGVVIAAWGDVTHKYFYHSMRKSLMSALYGIYVADGRIDLNATLKQLGIDDLTPLTELEKTATVEDLLSARSGVYLEAAGEVPSMKVTRPARGSHATGTFWYYNNWDFNALGTIFDQLSGEKNIYEAFDKRIAGPTGMQDFDPAELHYTYEPYSEHPYYGFRLSARDAARFGLLFMRDGRWGEKQIIPANWVRESTSAHSVIGPQSGYGYMWWLGEGDGGFANVSEGPGSYYASGANGQEIIVMPSRNLVVVHLVDSDVGHSVDETRIGTLLWMILDAAGEKNIGDPPSLAQAAGKRLTAKTLPKALMGHTLNAWTGGVKQEAIGKPDGTMTISLNGTPFLTGRWSVEGDTLCTYMESSRQCYQLVQNGNELRFFDPDGYAVMTFQVGPP